jgi:hypothetical protein
MGSLAAVWLDGGNMDEVALCGNGLRRRDLRVERVDNIKAGIFTEGNEGNEDERIFNHGRFQCAVRIAGTRFLILLGQF